MQTLQTSKKLTYTKKKKPQNDKQTNKQKTQKTFFNNFNQSDSFVGYIFFFFPYIPGVLLRSSQLLQGKNEEHAIIFFFISKI